MGLIRGDQNTPSPLYVFCFQFGGAAADRGQRAYCFTTFEAALQYIRKVSSGRPLFACCCCGIFICRCGDVADARCRTALQVTPEDLVYIPPPLIDLAGPPTITVGPSQGSRYVGLASFGGRGSAYSFYLF